MIQDLRRSGGASALDVERRKAWNELRQEGDPAAAKKFKGARWALLKKPANLIVQPRFVM
jgi:hypothetical protein